MREPRTPLGAPKTTKRYSLQEWAPENVTGAQMTELENEQWEIDSTIESDYSNSGMLEKLEAIPIVMRAIIRNEFSCRSMFVGGLPELFYNDKDRHEVGEKISEFLTRLKESEHDGEGAKTRAVAGEMAEYVKSIS